MLNWQQKLQIYIKNQKRHATIHTIIATAVTLVFITVFNLLDRPSIEKIDKDHTSKLTVTLVGDMMFGRNISDVVIPNYGHEGLFRYTLPYLKVSDYTTGNFESPIVLADGYNKADKFIHLRSQHGAAPALKKVGFHSVNLANNHMKDYGKQGLIDSLNTFEKNKIATVGAGRDLKEASKVSYETVRGIKIATLGISDILPREFGAKKDRSGILPADPDIFFPLVAKAKQNADLVIVHIHWGIEYDSGYHPRQKDIGHALVDAGADLVVGHHPHVLEPVEVYKNGVIFYSLGNFIFDQGWSRTRESVLVQYKLLKDGQARIELNPMFIREGQPRPLSGWSDLYRREKIFSQLTEEMMFTDSWNQSWKRDGNKLVRTIPTSVRAKGTPE
ncbi:CapA family protein [Thermoactinomyces sp. DSM 45892]|uniref:CapA family protein n=1 Tax=Thermoactinomyces sp. DSM 45892 TaxID=1882753 RepID=UPI000898D29A|nr:CapA family protein [Thermoactinomyces sp. DSM 45892]SDZ16634.1 poly-gamma-glutamate synthesis protein (capsule biosynthesis protein) [Thermoactinomyces sp. DSM 45892]